MPYKKALGRSEAMQGFLGLVPADVFVTVYQTGKGGKGCSLEPIMQVR